MSKFNNNINDNKKDPVSYRKKFTINQFKIYPTNINSNLNNLKNLLKIFKFK